VSLSAALAGSTDFAQLTEKEPCVTV